MNLRSRHIRPRHVRAGPIAAAIALALAGCAVGPDFKVPAAPPVANERSPYTPEPLPTRTVSAPGPAGAAQTFVDGRDIPALWWQVFHSEPLDALVRSAIEKSPSMDSARAALRQAQESYNADRGNRTMPAVSAQAGVQRERAANSGTALTMINASVDMSYTIDAFGGARRELEGQQAAVDYQRWQVEATYLTLTANVIATAIQEASLRAQIRATQDAIDSAGESLALVQKQAELGAVARGAVLAQSTQLAQVRATLPALESALAQNRHLLNVYAGRLSGDGGLPEFTLDSLQLPADLPVSLPSALVRQRPDIRASEALLHEASAQIGVATAALYPQITLSGSLGGRSTELSDLFKASSRVWSIGAGLLQPIFNGGALRAKKSAAEAAYDQADAQYRQAVLNAFLNVANTLRALDGDARTLAAQAEAASLAQDSLNLTSRQYQLGAVNYLALLDAQRAYQQTRITLAQAQAARYADTAALFQALGGGWWNREQAPVASLDTPRVAKQNERTNQEILR